MKNERIPAVLSVLGMLFLGPAIRSPAAFLEEGFEHLSVGQSAGDLPGWTVLRSGDVACSADSNRVFEGSRALDVPFQGSPVEDRWSSAAFTNFTGQYAPTSHPVIRMSLMLYRENIMQSVTIGMGRGTNLIVWVGSNPLRNAIVVNNHTTAVNFVTGRFASLHLLYDMAENKAALEYDGVNVMPWQAVGSAVCTQFNLFAVRRVTPRADITAQGDVALDLVSVETFPAQTRAWFRFEDEGPLKLIEHTGSFLPGTLHFTGYFEPGPWSELKGGNGATRNRSARRNFLAYDAAMARSTMILNDWTLEFLMRIDPSEKNGLGTPVFELEPPGSPMTASNAVIAVNWSTNEFMNVALRMDNCPLPGQLHNLPNFVPLPADGRWHHVALVRISGAVQAYLDYELYNSATLEADVSDGSYHPTPEHTLSMGRAGMTTNCSLDEVRLTAWALEPGEFIAVNGPAFAGGWRAEGTNLQVRVEQFDHVSYLVQINTNQLEGNGWQTWYTYAATGTTQVITFGRPPGPGHILRLR